MIGAAVTAALAFDLLCRGTMVSGYGPDRSTYKTEPSSMNFRVDLSSGRWCDRENCSETLPIARKTPTEIWFQQIATDQLRINSVVNRETGKLRYSTAFAGMAIELTATCEPAPFTGFPHLKF